MSKRKTPPIRTSDSDYTEEEQRLILQYVKELRQVELKEFLASTGHLRSGTKKILLDRIDESLAEGTIALVDLVDLLDQVEPWSAQHVFLLGEPNADVTAFRDPHEFEAHLKNHRASKPFRQPIQLALPEELVVSSITHDGARLRVTAIERRDGWHRDHGQDQRTIGPGGETIELRAYVNTVSRGLVMFEWDLIANQAVMQVTQLPSGWTYDDAFGRFVDVTKTWLPVATFPTLNLRRAISTFHEAEENKSNDLRSHGIEYETHGGRRVAGKSATPRDSVLGETVVDTAMHQIRDAGVGRSGNFYFDVTGVPGSQRGEAHAIIFAEAGRINFPTSNPEEVVRHVLDRIRAAC